MILYKEEIPVLFCVVIGLITLYLSPILGIISLTVTLVALLPILHEAGLFD
jgi:hypothetical protein